MLKSVIGWGRFWVIFMKSVIDFIFFDHRFLSRVHRTHAHETSTIIEYFNMEDTRTKRAVIWAYYTLDPEDTKFAKCNTCGEKVSRGGNSAKSHNTTNLVNHVKKKHTEVFHEFTEKRLQSENESGKGNKKSLLKQTTLLEARDRVKPWDVNDKRAQLIHCRIVEMIALDSQPFSVVEDLGFIRFVTALEPRYSLPSRQYLTSKVLPKIFEETVESVQQLLIKCSVFQFYY